ncbi:MAG: FkbM family methyltransferase [Ignavibacteriaceae bacterium]|jgi:FkbM family methyltransferase|nr:FkbM family methyltransferase [Ignavibacteriaceae bacterium]MCW8812169.1 FkbM family methyltransferase [Chlorobium sp.]MCW8996088.1 FkbM family methyltransferase [Psychromonas sp.]MCW8818297.1 FkbM family methyltransferase [Ignavibacteriaceae bacterium]MCW8823857.1 FkbM family methyltransferase [Ignavibacteriaceae bacterium]
MNKAIKKIKGLFNYLIGGYSTLSNWPSFITDLIRVQFGLKTKCIVYNLRDGTKFNVHKDSKGLNHVFYTVFLKGEYDELEKFSIKNDDIIVDVGAHLGFFTIKAAKKAINGRVYAFEPFSMHYKLLEKNIEQNKIKNVKYYNKAIFDKTGELSFYYTKEGDPSDTSLFKISQVKKSFEEKIKSISLNDFFQQEQLKICNFMKIDCEGAEYSILMNSDPSTLSKIQKIAMEWHRFTEEHDPKSLAIFLKDHGFKLIEPPSYDEIAGLLYAYR